MIKASLFVLLVICCITNSFAQGVAVNNNGAPPDASASLDVSGNQKGVLIPRLTTQERDQIISPATALLIYNTDAKQFQVNIGTGVSPSWKTIVSLDQPDAPKQIWLTGGNQGNETNAFIGNKDSEPLSLKTNNVLRLYIDSSTTKIGIGTSDPKVSLHINATDAMIVPVGTTGQRPPTPVVGMIRFNATSGKLEGYTTGGWVALN